MRAQVRKHEPSGASSPISWRHDSCVARSFSRSAPDDEVESSSASSSPLLFAAPPLPCDSPAADKEADAPLSDALGAPLSACASEMDDACGADSETASIATASSEPEPARGRGA